MLKSVATAFVAVVALGSLSACSGSVSVGSSSVSSADVEAQMQSQLKDADGVGPDKSSCPDDLKAEVGATITCTATSGDETFKIEAVVTAVDGDNVDFDLNPVE